MALIDFAYQVEAIHTITYLKPVEQSKHASPWKNWRRDKSLLVIEVVFLKPVLLVFLFSVSRFF